MADEVSTLMVLRMRDEASAQMQNFATTTEQSTVASGALGESVANTSTNLTTMTGTTEQAAMATLNLQMTLTACGSALTAVGSLLNQLDNPSLKAIANFLTIGGAVMTTASAIGTMLPMIRNLITWLKALNFQLLITKALSGPAGWITLGVGAAVVGGGAYALSRAGGGGGGTNVTVVNNNIGGSVITERELGNINRRTIIKNQDQNGTSGIR